MKWTNVGFRGGTILLALALPLAPRAAERATPGQSDALLRQAVSAFQEGRKQEALRLANELLTTDGMNLRGRLVRGRILSELGEPARSVDDFSEFIRLGGGAQQPSVYQLRGVEYFRMGDAARSVADFDLYLKAQPEQAAQHWQRGISCYYARQFEAGRRQFELHQTVNPNDVENAVWHYLCVAQLAGVDAARAGLMPIRGDTRVPMMEIHGLYAGRVKPDDVLAAANRDRVNSEALKERLFYAHLYLGLYYEAQGDRAKTREHLREAAVTYSVRHYMGDVARVHWRLLEQGWEPSGRKTEPVPTKAGGGGSQ